jgi:hypothetical protein
MSGAFAIAATTTPRGEFLGAPLPDILNEYFSVFVSAFVSY